MIEDIGTAIKEALLDLPYTVAWPNVPFDPTLGPYVQAQIEMTAGARLSLRGRHRITGSLILTAVSAEPGTGHVDAVHDTIAAAFPVDLELPLPSGQAIRITAAPMPRSGFRDGAYWRAPIIIPFEILT